MKQIKSITILALIILVMSINVQAQRSIYSKAGIIKIRDNRAISTATAGITNGVFEISFNDIIKTNGHACACGMAGFLITKEVLNMFYPNQIPVRGNLKVMVAEYNPDLIDAINLVLGTRLERAQYTNSESDFTIDPMLKGEEGNTVLVFEQKDSGKQIEVVIHKKILLNKEEMQVLSTIKPKIKSMTASKEEIKKYGKITQQIVKKMILNLPEGAITYKGLN